MSDYKEKLIKERIEEKKVAPIMRFNNSVRTNFQGLVYFVEGKSDEKFYKNTNVPIMNNDCMFIYRKLDETTEENKYLVGKESVLFCYNYIKNDLELRKENRRCIFLVDYDFDGLTSNSIKFDKMDSRKITITPFHSMESFFVTGGNIKKIVEFFLLSEKEAQQIVDALKNLAKATAEFFALKGAITFSFKQSEIYEKVGYTKKAEPIVDSSQAGYINKKLLEEEIKKMHELIKDKPKVKKEYDKIKKQIGEDPLYIQGHTAFDFLKIYLFNEYGIDIEQDKNLIRALEINMEIKTANGKVINPLPC